MRYCLNCRVSAEYLRQADEIKVEFRDRNYIITLAEKYPNKPIILMFDDPEVEIDWNEIKEYKILSKDMLICCVRNSLQCIHCREIEVPFYIGYPIESFSELESLQMLGACYVRLGPELFFNLPDVKRYNIPVRAVPNVAYSDYLPRIDGVTGQWIRPEDEKTYDKYITTYEFEDCDVRKEEALFRIYALQKRWPGEFNMLFTNFNAEGLNRLIPPELAKHRVRCGHRCKHRSNSCHLCHSYVRLAEEDTARQIVEQIEKQKEKK